MNETNRARVVLLLGFLLATGFWPATGRAELARPPRVLLVGNSYTHFNMLPRQLERLAASAGTPLRVDAITHGGYSLRMHWRNRATRMRVVRGGYRYVVLQDHSLRPVDHPDEFEDYGKRFARAALDGGAQPVFYETWPRSPRSQFYRTREQPRSPDEMAARLERAYAELAERQGAFLAPVGRAFAELLDSAPEVELYRRDGTHPSWAGTYLAACVLYGTITQRDPRGASYVPWELPPEQARMLRELAARVLGLSPQPTQPAGGMCSAEALACETTDAPPVTGSDTQDASGRNTQDASGRNTQITHARRARSARPLPASTPIADESLLRVPLARAPALQVPLAPEPSLATPFVPSADMPSPAPAQPSPAPASTAPGVQPVSPTRWNRL